MPRCRLTHSPSYIDLPIPYGEAKLLQVCLKVFQSGEKNASRQVMVAGCEHVRLELSEFIDKRPDEIIAIELIFMLFRNTAIILTRRHRYCYETHFSPLARMILLFAKSSPTACHANMSLLQLKSYVIHLSSGPGRRYSPVTRAARA